jgi:RimJ/RimL family protein N-acetyltransferase
MERQLRPPPYRIVTERLVVRCWEPRDAPLVKDAIDSSLAHLRPWMPWAHEEPQTPEAKAELLRTFRARFDLGEDFVYGILDGEDARVLGGTGLHTRVGDGAFEIGYWIRADATRRGYATEAAAALTRVAFAVAGVDRVEIRVEPGNDASLAVPRRLGFAEEATLRRRLPPNPPAAEPRDLVLFSLFAADFPQSPCAAAAASIEAYDVLGRRLLL